MYGRGPCACGRFPDEERRRNQDKESGRPVSQAAVLLAEVLGWCSFLLFISVGFLCDSTEFFEGFVAPLLCLQAVRLCVGALDDTCTVRGGDCPQFAVVDKPKHVPPRDVKQCRSLGDGQSGGPSRLPARKSCQSCA